MVISCPKCGAKYRLKDDVTTGKVKCKKCQTVLDVKATAVPDAQARSEEKAVISAAPSEKSAAERAQAATVVPSAEAAEKTRAQEATVVPTGPKGEPRRSQAPTVVQTAAKKPAAPRAATPPANALIGKALGGYEILRKLGEGGMGAVYEARQVALDRSVALKVLPAHLAANRTFIMRFTREALSVAKLNHNNIIQIYDVGKAEGIYFFSMEFVRGKTLGDLVEKEGKMDPRTAVGYIVQSARGLEYAHRKNIIHRDIKPDNIMINEEGVAKVADLGLAKQVQEEELSVTMSGVGMGTPHYMPPEQASDAKKVDHRADIYSLGCTLYHLITGKIPYDGDSAYEIITKHVNEPLTPPSAVDADIPEELSKVVEKMLAKQKEDRYASMKEVTEALERYLGVSFAKAGYPPTEDQIATLRRHAGAVEAILGSRIARGILLAMAVVFLILAVVSFSAPKYTVALIEYAVVGVAFYFVLQGSLRKTYLYRRVRKFLFGNKISDWLVIGVVVIVVVVGILLLGAVGVLALILAGGTAAGFYFGVRRPLLTKLDAAIEEVKKFIREIRRKGIPEESIHLFVCREGGACGEFLCEQIAGYDAVVATRAQRSTEELEKRRFGAKLREGVIGWLNAAEEKREKEKQARPEVKMKAAAAGARTAAIAPSAQGTAAGMVEAPVVAEVVPDLEEKKPGVGALILDVPKFILGGKGRVSIGAVMALLAALSWTGKAFSESANLRSYNYGLFSVALLISGFVRSKAALALLLISCAVTGPVVLFAGDKVAVLSREIALPAVNRVVTPIHIAGAVLLLLGLIAGLFIRRKNVETA